MATNGYAQQGGGQTAYSTTDWDSYMKGRPKYPQSLIDIIKNYRKLHGSASRERVVDIGGGNGVALTKFADSYDVIHLSDPSPTNIEQGSRFLPDFVAKNGLNPKIEYSQTIGEEAYKHVGEQAVDLVICATAAHFAVPDDLAASIAKMLRPGGTMAIFSYFLAQFPEQSESFQDRFHNVFFGAIQLMRDHSDETMNKFTSRAFKAISAGEGGVDYFPLPDEYFRDKQRFIINGSTSETAINEKLRKLLLQPGEQPAPSRVLENEPKTRVQTDQSPLAEGWDQYADRVFVRHFIESLRPSGSYIPDSEFDKLHAEFDRLWDEVPSERLLMRWPCTMVLATRK